MQIARAALTCLLLARSTMAATDEGLLGMQLRHAKASKGPGVRRRHAKASKGPGVRRRDGRGKSKPPQDEFVAVADVYTEGLPTYAPTSAAPPPTYAPTGVVPAADGEKFTAV